MLEIANKYLDPRLIIFDKDGTLIDFHPLWHYWFKSFICALGNQVKISEHMYAAINQTLGYKPDDDSWDPQGPLTLAPIHDICLLLSGIIYRYTHMSWSQSVALVNQVEHAVRENLPLAELVRPVGDARGLLERLREAGLRLAVATSDIQQITQESLKAAQIDDLFDIILCADDNIPVKPAPDAALAICERLSIPPSQTILVGDSIDDLNMARAAGLMAAIGVTSGASPKSILEPLADVLVKDIHDIHII